MIWSTCVLIGFWESMTSLTLLATVGGSLVPCCGWAMATTGFSEFQSWWAWPVMTIPLWMFMFQNMCNWSVPCLHGFLMCVCHGAVAIAHARQQQQAPREMIAMDYPTGAPLVFPKMAHQWKINCHDGYCPTLLFDCYKRHGRQPKTHLVYAGKQVFFLLYSACRCAKAFYMALHSSAWSPSWSSPLALLGVGADLAFLYALLVLNASFASWAT